MNQDPSLVCSTLRRLSGQSCTPPGTPADLVRHVQAEGLARFQEWPSGHWQITEAGSEFLAENEG